MKLSALAGTALTLAALAWSVPAPGNIATATASVPDFCAEIGGNWDGANCVATVESERKATRTITMALPDGLIDNPTIHDYLRTLMNNWKTAAVHMAADSFAEEHFEVFNHGGTMTAAFHEVYSATYGTDAGTLIARADAAMYCAKRGGGGNFAFHQGSAPAGADHLVPEARRLLPDTD